MKNKGLKLKKYDPLDERFKFYAVFGSLNPLVLPDEYFLGDDAMPDQNAESAPTECTAYTVTELAKIEDGREYSHDYNHMKAVQIFGANADSPVSLKSAFKVPCTFGLLPKELAPIASEGAGQHESADQKNWPLALDAEANKYRKPGYFGIDYTALLDVFDSARSAMWITKDEKRAIGLGISWYGDFEQIGDDGILPDNPSGQASGHSPVICGWTKRNTRGELIRNGEIFLKVKSWQGTGYGDKGWCYISRALINKLLAEWGSDAQMLAKIDPGTIERMKQQQVTFIEVIAAFLKNLAVAFKQLRMN